MTITASIGVTGLWIMPRLGGFQQRHPDIDVRVAANNRVVDLRTGGADVAIRYCPASNAPPGSQRLFGEAVAPVAHPSLGVSRLDRKSIAAHVLIEYDDFESPLAAMGATGSIPWASAPSSRRAFCATINMIRQSGRRSRARE